MAEKRLLVFYYRTLVSFHAYIIRLKGFCAQSFVLVEVPAMKLITEDEIAQCLTSQSGNFKPDMARWQRSDNFYQKFHGMFDCNVQAIIGQTFVDPLSDDHYALYALRNRIYVFWYRALYSTTAIIAYIMLLRQFINAIELLLLVLELELLLLNSD